MKTYVLQIIFEYGFLQKLAWVTGVIHFAVRTGKNIVGSGRAVSKHLFIFFLLCLNAEENFSHIREQRVYIDLSAIGGCSGSPIFLDTTPPKFLGILVSGAADSSSESSCVSMYVPGYKVLELIKGY